MRATHLRCEHREDTPLVGCAQPRFGWALESDGRDRRQTGYRLLVAASEAELAREEGSLWDSGDVASARTIEIEYEGSALPPASEMVWTVRVLDESGSASRWADPARFRTGLDAWDASWISCDRREDMALVDPGLAAGAADDMLFKSPPVPFLRRGFELHQAAKRATLYATARGVLEMQLNGQRVGDSLLAPGWTDYHKRIEYAAHDVTDLLQSGENVLGCVLGEGWYAGFFGEHPKQVGAMYGSDPELLCELHIELEHGGVKVIRSDGSWRATPQGPIRYSDLLHGERYDARRELPGWSEPGFDDTAWAPVRRKPLDSVALVPEKGPPIRVTEDLRPVSITEHRPGVHIFDLGQNMVGRARLQASGEAGAEVRLRFGEALDADGALYVDNLAAARQTDIFVFRGGGTEVFEPRFTVHGFRYVEVSGLAAEPTAETITGRVIHSDTPWTSTYTCSNDMVNQLYSNISWGQRGNFLSVPTDCPQRNERYGWLADAQVFLPTASLNADVAAFMAKWGDDVLDAQSAEGVYPDIAPRGTWDFDGAPGWADAGILVPALLYERYGDRRLLERHWPHMRRYLAHLLRHNPDLLWKRRRNHDFGDWLAVGEETPKELLATAFWANDARLMARMARVLGEPAEHYERLAAGITAAFNAAYVGEDGVVEGDTQTGYLLALAFDLLPEEMRPRAVQRLVANIERHDWHLTTGFIGVGLLCPVLTANDHADVAHRLLLQDTFPSWGYSISQGATTIWERWDGYTEDRGFQSSLMNSFNHYSLGSVGAWMVESVLGIRSDPGRGVAYERVVIEPVPGELTAARGSYRSIRGEIASAWIAAQDRFELTVQIPPNVEATIVVPARGGALLEGGAPAATAAGVRSVTRRGDAWRVEVGSGRYEFSSGEVAERGTAAAA
jgi:alpha-L-rhamnosidase